MRVYKKREEEILISNKNAPRMERGVIPLKIVCHKLILLMIPTFC